MLIVVCLALFFLQTTGMSLFALYSIREHRKASEHEAIRLTLLAESALNHIRAKSLDEFVQATSAKQAHNVQLEMLRDSYAKEVAQKKAAKAPEPLFVKTDDGREIDLQEYEVLG